MAAATVMAQRERSRLLDTFYLIGAALLVCLFGGGAFAVADVYHISPLWVFFGLVSVGFFAGAREEHRKEFRSPRFVAFVCGWIIVNIGVIIVCLSLVGWLLLIPALLIEPFLFYMSAYWFFGMKPFARRRWPFQRNESSDKDEV